MYAQGASADTERVRSVFHIEKSENRNEVHYDVRVDGDCRPLQSEPVIGYWREREQGPNVILPLTFFERRAYGVHPDSVAVRWAADGGTVEFALRPLPRRRIAIRTFKRRGHCRARAWALIDGQLAQLDSVFVQVGFLTAEHIVLRGSDRRGRPLRERIAPTRKPRPRKITLR